jgi:hypothetical protein
MVFDGLVDRVCLEDCDGVPVGGKKDSLLLNTFSPKLTNFASKSEGGRPRSPAPLLSSDTLPRLIGVVSLELRAKLDGAAVFRGDCLRGVWRLGRIAGVPRVLGGFGGFLMGSASWPVRVAMLPRGGLFKVV